MPLPKTTSPATSLNPLPQQPPGDPAWHARLGSALERQLELLTQLEGLSQQQRSLVDAEDPEPLLEHMNARQAIVDELVALDQAMIEPRAQLHAASTTPNAGLDRATRESLHFRLTLVASRAKAIMQRDAKDQERLQARKKQAAEELAELAGAKRAVNAYSSPRAAGGAIYQDREG